MLMFRSAVAVIVGFLVWTKEEMEEFCDEIKHILLEILF